jgi:tetratricopeptide (TPR) repeat protein
MADDKRQPAASSAADALALDAHGTLDPRAAAFLEKQGQLADEQATLARLQSENLVEQNAYELSHLRFRRFSDWTRFSLEAAGFLLVLLVLCAIGAMVWNATQDRDLVVEAFSVPNDVAQTGLTGSVLAGRVIDRVGQMQADTYSVTQGIGTYKSISADAVRIQIPATGISIGELDSYLRQWLGHESIVTGALVRTAKGYSATIRYADQAGGTVESADLDSLTTKAAEQLYRAARPLRYADYLTSHGRFDEALRIILPLARDGSARERASAYVSWATLLYQQGDPRGQMEKGAIATQLDPSNAGGWYELDGGAYNVQHREVAIKAEKTVIALIKQGKAGDVAPDLADKVLTGLHADLAIDMGDPAGAIAQCQLVPDIVALDCGMGFPR